MTRKQFFRLFNSGQRYARNFFINLVKKYNGRLSYRMLYACCYCLALSGIFEEEDILEGVEIFVNLCSDPDDGHNFQEKLYKQIIK